MHAVGLITCAALRTVSVYELFFEDWGRRGWGRTLLPPGRRNAGVQGGTSWCWWGDSPAPLDVGVSNSERFAGALPNLALRSGPVSAAPFLVQSVEHFTHASFLDVIVVFVN